MADRTMREIAHMRVTIAAMRKPMLARYRSAMMSKALSRCAMMGEALGRFAMMGQALRCRARVSGVREMSGASRMDAACVDRATMRAPDVTEMRAADVAGRTAKMRRPPTEMHAAAAKVRCTTAAKVGRTTATKVGRTTAAKMRCAAAKVHAPTPTAEMRCATATKVGAATTTKVGAATPATEMRRGNCERKSGNAEA